MKLNFFTRELQDNIKKSRADIKELQATIIELKKDINKARAEQIRQQILQLKHLSLKL